MKTIYWISTLLITLWMGLNAFFYVTSPEAKVLCTHFGFPDYFRIELAIAKVIGILVLLFAKGRVREWAYAGFTITIVSGVVAHVCSGDQFPISALLAIIILGVSYMTSLHLYYDAPAESSYRPHQ